MQSVGYIKDRPDSVADKALGSRIERVWVRTLVPAPARFIGRSKLHPTKVVKIAILEEKALGLLGVQIKKYKSNALVCAEQITNALRMIYIVHQGAIMSFLSSRKSERWIPEH